VQGLNEAFYFVLSVVLADSLVLRNPFLRQAPKRWNTVQTMKPHKRIRLGLEKTFGNEVKMNK
jgi:hypothetical protein